MNPIDEASDDVDQGRVIRTDPRGGSSVEPGSTVTIVVSTGVDLVEVPSVIGFNEDQARNLLEQEAYGFEVSTRNEETCDEPADLVYGQDPQPGEEVPRGTTVTILIAQEPPEGCNGDGDNGGGNGGGNGRPRRAPPARGCGGVRRLRGPGPSGMAGGRGPDGLPAAAVRAAAPR